MHKSNDLPYPDCFHAESAEAWLALGLPEESLIELDKIQPEYQMHPLVIQFRSRSCRRTRRFDQALTLARQLKAISPDDYWGYFSENLCLRDMHRLNEAYQVLKEAVKHFPENDLLWYNLACDACLLGCHDEALKCFRMSLQLHKRNQAGWDSILSDSDLAAIRPKILEAYRIEKLLDQYFAEPVTRKSPNY